MSRYHSTSQTVCAPGSRGFLPMMADVVHHWSLRACANRARGQWDGQRSLLGGRPEARCHSGSAGRVPRRI